MLEHFQNKVVLIFMAKIAINIANLILLAPKIQKESTKSNNEESQSKCGDSLITTQMECYFLLHSQSFCMQCLPTKKKPENNYVFNRTGKIVKYFVVIRVFLKDE